MSLAVLAVDRVPKKIGVRAWPVRPFLYSSTRSHFKFRARRGYSNHASKQPLLAESLVMLLTVMTVASPGHSASSLLP
jgi:hypothetical protein